MKKVEDSKINDDPMSNVKGLVGFEIYLRHDTIYNKTKFFIINMISIEFGTEINITKFEYFENAKSIFKVGKGLKIFKDSLMGVSLEEYQNITSGDIRKLFKDDIKYVIK